MTTSRLIKAEVGSTKLGVSVKFPFSRKSKTIVLLKECRDMPIPKIHKFFERKGLLPSQDVKLIEKSIARSRFIRKKYKNRVSRDEEEPVKKKSRGKKYTLLDKEEVKKLKEKLKDLKEREFLKRLLNKKPN